MTLIEVVVSSAILAVLMVATMTLLISTQNAATRTAITMDLDEEARRAVRELRKEIRQSGWELSLHDPGSQLLGNQLEVPGGTVFPSPMSNKLQLRKRVAFSDPADEIEDWTNDGAGAKHYVKWERISDGSFRGVPGGPINRYKLVRAVGPLDGEIPLGTVINNLEDVEFYRMGWDEVLIKLKFLFPDPAGPTEEPLRIQINERVQVQNRSLNGV